MLGGLSSLVVAACSGDGGGDGSGDGAPVDCVEAPSTGAGNYCLVDGLVIRVVAALDLAPGAASVTNVDDATAVIVARDDAGWYARSAICTHACCVLALCEDAACSKSTTTPEACGARKLPVVSTALCPCHGSIFAIADGAALLGPATRPLPAYAIEFDGGDVLVDTGLEVDAGDRFMP